MLVGVELMGPGKVEFGVGADTVQTLLREDCVIVLSDFGMVGAGDCGCKSREPKALV
jgi:hypothetical protein